MCNLCGKKGYKASVCWENPKNTNKRLSWHKLNGEVSATGKDVTKSKEIQLVNMHWGRYAEEFISDQSDWKRNWNPFVMTFEKNSRACKKTRAQRIMNMK
jgi:hypothetical protein